MTTTEIVWLAGLLEGEGCFGSTKGKQPMIWLTLCDKDVVDRAAVLFNHTARERAKGTGGKRAAYATWAGGNTAIEIMKAILPYMGERRTAKIKQVLEAAASREGLPRGSKNRASKLTEQQVRTIKRRALVEEKYGFCSRIAREHGVSKPAINALLSGKTWGHVGV